MKQPVGFSHQFVEFIPEELDENVLYVSIRFATVSHLCACGCKMKVVTPLKPTDWSLTFNGKTVSLYPSIGNWNFSCRSHYWIRHNFAMWAEDWSQERVDAGRAHDRARKNIAYQAKLDDADGRSSLNKKSKKSWYKRWWPLS